MAHRVAVYVLGAGQNGLKCTRKELGRQRIRETELLLRKGEEFP